MKYRSHEILKRPEWSMVRSLYKSMGYTDYDLERPMVGIVNSWNTLTPGHYNLRQVAGAVREGIIQGGGTPLEFGTIAACDGIAQGNLGMHYILPTRDLIANDIELMVEAHRLDALVLLGSCDKIVPGMLMAAARLDLPAVLVPGGPMEGGMEFDNHKSDATSVTEAYGMLKSGNITEEEYLELEDNACPTCGSCGFLGTANTMCCLAEGMGMTLPGGGTSPATSAERLRIAKNSGRAIIKLIEKGITARKIINKDSLENAIKLTMAIGGSTNAALHLPAVAYEAETELPVELFDKFSRETPHVAKIYPAGPKNVPDFHNAGGVMAVLKEIKPLLNYNVMTVTGNTLEESIEKYAEVRDRDMIKPMSEPFNEEGGMAVLTGNLAPNTAISKPAAIDPSMWTFTGSARVFNSEEEAYEAIANQKIKEGDVVVIRYEGPKGGPGMREMYTAMKMLYGMGLALKTALVTDGRFSGTNNGCFVGHVSPEAAEGGPLAIVNEGDKITIDIKQRKLELHVSQEEIEQRLKSWQKPPRKIKKGYLSLYSKLAESANLGAIIRHRDEE